MSYCTVYNRRIFIFFYNSLLSIVIRALIVLIIIYPICNPRRRFKYAIRKGIDDLRIYVLYFTQSLGSPLLPHTHIAHLDIKGFICHFKKSCRCPPPFISKGTIYMRQLTLSRLLKTILDYLNALIRMCKKT